MSVIVREYTADDVGAMAAIWNEVVREGNAFPQQTELSLAEAEEFFTDQTRCGVAERDGEIRGIYILHPNNVGRCGHIANASYAVASESRGSHIGEALVRDCIKSARESGFRILQFNAVVATNTAALNLYEKMGFRRLGVIKGGFRLPNGEYEDIIPHVIAL